MQREYFLSDITPVWSEALQSATEEVIVFCPFITSIEILKRVPEGVAVSIYTTFQARYFAAGASSLDALRGIIESGFSLFSLPDLHAKIIIVDEKIVTMGSQNLTRKGKSNLEATAAVRDASQIVDIRKQATEWLCQRSPITIEMIDQMAALIPAMLVTHEAHANECAAIDQQLALSRLTQLKASIQDGLDFYPVEEIEDYEMSEIAAEFVAYSTYMNTRSGEIIEQPNYCEKLEDTQHGWVVRFGRDTFLVSKAILRCRNYVQALLDGKVDGIRTRRRLEEELMGEVAKSVAVGDGSEYKRAKYLDGDYLAFGFMKINACHFVRYFLKSMPIEEFLQVQGSVGE